MKRTASEALGEGPAAAAAPAAATFQPNAAALFDPKAYFQQWQQQAATSGVVPMPPQLASAAAPAVASVGAAAPSVGSAAAGAAPAPRSEIIQQIEQASAVKCAGIIKEKGANFTTNVALEAFNTLATKSSFKLREELVRQPPVRKLCLRIQDLLKLPPSGFGLPTLARAVWNMTHFPEDVRGDPKATLGPTARLLSGLQPTEWDADSAAKVLWSLAKVDIIGEHKKLVSQVVADLVRDKGRRVNELTDEALMNLLWSVARARRHVHAGDHQTVHMEANDEFLFRLASNRIIETSEKVDVRHLADLIHTHAEIGIKNEKLFKALCPRLCAKQKDLREDVMGKVIKAYTRFMIPLREEAQGFRTMAIVQKGDFIRPSEKPRFKGKRTYDHPQSLYPKTQVHTRG